jgi:hypothetical protein
MTYDEENKIGIVGNPDSDNFVRVSLSEFKNKTYLDIRRMWNNEGEILPTKKGVTIQIEDIDNLIKILQKIKG